MHAKSTDAWTKTNETLVYDGYRKILRREFTLPNGKSANFDVVASNGAAAILAITPEHKILCFAQFRPGPEALLFELPGGAIDNGENPPSAAQRELAEETGYTADLTYLGSYYRDAYTTGKSHMFIGRSAKPATEPKLDATEFGRLALLSISQFKENLFAGQMSDTTLGYAGLHHLGLL